ncbi:hypothetical protein HBIAX_04777 [Achromobacter xylosoxidans]|nr:hypothetical protein HBIAX_04777 [Achromobacter xylosoxidans]
MVGIFAPAVCPSIEERANRVRPRLSAQARPGQQQREPVRVWPGVRRCAAKYKAGDTHAIRGAVGTPGWPGVQANLYARVRPNRLRARRSCSNLAHKHAGGGISAPSDRDGHLPCTMQHRRHPPRRTGALPLTSHGTRDMSRHLQTAPLYRHSVDRTCHEASPQFRPMAALLCESCLRHSGPAYIAGPPRADAAQPAVTTIFPCAARIPRETKSPCLPVVHCVPAPRGAPRPACA